MKLHRLILALAVIGCLLSAYSCKAIAKLGGGHFVAVIDAQSGQEHPAHGRTNGSMSLYKADVNLVIRVLNTDGITVIEHRVEAGKIGLVDRGRDFRHTYAPGELLPLWALELFPDGDRATAHIYGFEFEPDPINL